MYHLLIALSLIVAQNYIDKNNVKQVILEKYEENLQNPETDFAHQQQPESKKNKKKETPEIENIDEIIDIAQGEDIIEVPQIPTEKIQEEVKKLEQKDEKITEFDLKNLEKPKIIQNIVQKEEKTLEETKKPKSDFKSAQNLLDDLRKKEDAKQKELDKLVKEDLESLGLDIVDEDFTNASDQNNNDFASVTKDKKEAKTVQNIEKEEEKTVQNQDSPDNLPDVQNMIAQEKAKKNVPLSEKQLEEFSNLAPKLPKSAQNSEKKNRKTEKAQNKENKENTEETSVVDSVADSIKSVTDKIAKSFIKDSSNDAQENITNLTQEEKSKKSKKAKTAKKATKAAKEKAKIAAKKKAQAERKKRRIATQKLKKKRENAILKALEKRKRLILAKLRKEYIDDFRNHVVLKDTENFGIPEKKILPRFIVYSLPKELLNRNKNRTNQHHPNIITPVEYANFMFESVASNRMDDFRSLFKVIRDPDIKNTKGDTVLIFAILMQKYEAITFLLANGANPNLPNKLGYTPLNVAIEMGDYISVELLLALGGDINYVDDFGENYLMQATRVGYYPVVDLLIEKGINVNKLDLAGFSAIDVAIKHNDKILTKYFKRLGAQKNNIEYQRRRMTLIEQLQNRWR